MQQFINSEDRAAPFPWERDDGDRRRCSHGNKPDRPTDIALRERFWQANLIFVAFGIGLVVLSLLPFFENKFSWQYSLRAVGLAACLFVGINAVLATFRIHDLIDRGPTPLMGFDRAKENAKNEREADLARVRRG